jgi:hypothetical protein
MRSNKPISIAILFGAVATVLLYNIGMVDVFNAVREGVLGRGTINLVLALYTITFLQRMLEERNHLLLAEESLTNIFNSRRVNAMLAPFVIGLLPSPGAVLIVAPIVNNAAGDSLDTEEKTFVSSYFRHIPEAFLPTFPAILLAINLSGVEITPFILGMLPLILVLFYLGYIFYVKKIPKTNQPLENINRTEEIKKLVKSLWSILLTIAIILLFGAPVHVSAILVIILSIFINKFSFEEIKPMFKTAFESKLIVTTIIIMVFKELLAHTGVIEELPTYFSQLPISPYIVYGIIFFFGTILIGSQGMVAVALPLAFATIPGAGLPLLVFLMGMTYIAMQISPTHICLPIIVEEYGTTFSALVRKTMPVLISFIVILRIYSYLLYIFL